MSRQFDNSIQDQSQNYDNMNSLEDIDPSLQDGFQIVYDREVPLELSIGQFNELHVKQTEQQSIINNPKKQEVLRALKSKFQQRNIFKKTIKQNTQKYYFIVHKQPSQNQYNGGDLSDQAIKIEFTSETDLFFFYITMQILLFVGNQYINYESFKQIKEDNKLKMEYGQFLSQLIKLFNQCYKEPHNFFGIFEMEEEGRANLKLIENMEYKFLEILSLDFIACEEDLVKQNVIYRYNILKAKMLFVQSRLEDISNLIKLKNPSLLVQIQKNTLSGNLSASTMRNSANQSKYNPNNSRFLK